MKVIQLLIIEN